MTAPNHWSISGSTLSRTFIVENYDAAFDLAYEIKEVADDLGHHPDITLTYNAVSVSTTTHDADGLTEKDYELAEAINEVYDSEDDFDDFDDDLDIDDDDDDDDDEFDDDDDNEHDEEKSFVDEDDEEEEVDDNSEFDASDEDIY